MFLKRRIRRVVAGGGILALALAGLLGTQTAASAEGYHLPPDSTGSLTLHKHLKDAQSTPGNPAGAPLAGVGFSVQQLGKMVGPTCTAIDLTTQQGWEDVSDALDAFVPGSTTPPTGFCLTGSNHNPVTLPGGTVTVTGLKGLYFVQETDPGPHTITWKEPSFLVTVPMPVPGSPGTWDFSVDAYPKNETGTFTPDKTVEGSNVDGSVVPGALVPWEVSVTIPKAVFPYTTIQVTDSPKPGHTFEAWGEVRLNGVLLAAPGSPTPDYSVSGNVLTFTGPGLAKVNVLVVGDQGAAAELKVKLTTKVTGTVLGGLKNEADVKLNGETKTTPTPQSNWGKLVIKKHKAGDNNASLAGAKFAVYPKTVAGCAVDVTGTPVWQTPATPDPSAAEQSAVLWISNTLPGQPVGSKVYCLQETQAPTGYLLDPTPREVTISTANDWVTTLRFPNTPVEGPELPLTGSTGTMAFAFIGFGLIAAAGTMYTVRRVRTSKR